MRVEAGRRNPRWLGGRHGHRSERAPRDHVRGKPGNQQGSRAPFGARRGRDSARRPYGGDAGVDCPGSFPTRAAIPSIISPPISRSRRAEGPCFKPIPPLISWLPTPAFRNDRLRMICSPGKTGSGGSMRISSPRSTLSTATRQARSSEDSAGSSTSRPVSSSFPKSTSAIRTQRGWRWPAQSRLWSAKSLPTM